ncbi:MAG: hypothetical protein ACJ76R_01355 [Solirubrobacteraceae bacterium]
MSAEPAMTLSAVRPVESADMYPVIERLFAAEWDSLLATLAVKRKGLSKAKREEAAAQAVFELCREQTLKAGESVKERLYRRALDRCTDEVRRARGRSGDASTRVEDVPDDWLENVAAPEAVEDRVCGCCVTGRPAPWRGAGGAAR